MTEQDAGFTIPDDSTLTVTYTAPQSALIWHTTTPPVQRALITGAHGQLGRACRIVAEERAWHAYCLNSRQELDLADWPAVARWVAEQEQGFDLVVLAHGVHRIQPLTKVDAADYRYMLDNNLGASIALTAALLQAQLLCEGGLLVYCSSLQATHTRAGRALYAAAKAGLEGFMHGVAAELAGHGRAVALRLGQLRTLMADVTLPTEEIARLQARCYAPWGHSYHIAKFIWDIYEQPSLTGCVLDIDSGQGTNVW